MIDLHSHTTASDGVHPPAELVALAVSRGVRILAITDHDTTAGVEAAERAAREGGGAVRIVPGVEVSAQWKGSEIHVLGHFVDPADTGLNQRLERYRSLREGRMEAMVARCRSRGLDVSLEEIAARNPGGGTLGRPHLARLLVEKGHARDFQDAFDRWIGKGGPCWVERLLPDAAEVIETIHRAGGRATIAHPALSGLKEADLVALARAGLKGIEVDHPAQPPDIRRHLRRIAAALGLAATAGSDYHAPEVGGMRLGSEGMDPDAFTAYERSGPASTAAP